MTWKINTLLLLLLVSAHVTPVHSMEIYHRLEEPLSSREVRSDLPTTAPKYLKLRYTYTPEVLKKINSEAKLPDKLFIRLEVQGSTSTALSIVRHTIQLQSGAHELYFYPQQYGTIHAINILYYDGRLQESFKLLSLKIYVEQDTKMHAREYTVRTASLEDILHWNATSGETHHEDFMLYRWQSYPDVLIFSFKSRDAQAKYLKRLAFFNEKKHTRGTIQDLESIAHRKGWGAHDYKAKDIALFFTEVSRLQHEGARIQLEQEELLLLDILLSIETITAHTKDTNAYTTYDVTPKNPDSSIVSFARSDSLSLQETLLYHELLHTYYFRDLELRETMKMIWNRFSPEDKRIWKNFLSYNGYDPEYEYLVVNELFAYLLQRPIDSLSWYVPARIIKESVPKVGRSKAQEFTKVFIENAKEISRYMFLKYNISDGKVKYIWKY